MQRDLGKYRIKYDVWFHESDLHSSGAVKAVVDKLLETGACYKAEDGAIMYRSAQYAAKYGVVNKRKTDDGSEEEAKDEVLVRANGIPTYFAADIAYHYNKLAVRGFDKASTSGRRPPRPRRPHEGRDGRYRAGRQPPVHRADADGQPHARRQARAHEQAYRQGHHPDRPAGRGAH